MNSSILSFSLKLLGLLAGVFGVHILALYVRKSPLFDDYLLISYGLNLILTVAIYSVVTMASKKQSAQGGFVFLFGSAVKFLLFLIILKPLFKADGEISGVELASFFVPYLVCLIYEVYILSKTLNNK
ncbi:MAG: F0F1-type ATP synthase assembly protein I [Dokdonia sp.]|jgi:F0F1-type ATP synthase assembly protein I